MPSLNILPTELRGGETISEEISLADYSPSNGDALRYEFAASTPVSIECTEKEDGSGWTLTVPSDVTVQWGTGTVGYVGYVTQDDDVVVCIDEGFIHVRASPMFASWAARALQAVESVIEGRASADEASMQIGDVSISRMRLDDLLRLRDWLRGQIARDRGASFPRRILGRFL